MLKELSYIPQHGSEKRRHDNVGACAILGESGPVEDERDHLARGEGGDTTELVATGFGESLGGLASVGIGAQPLLGWKNVTAPADHC
jgi:hypothetical protein